jgi:hypothetical protein
MRDIVTASSATTEHYTPADIVERVRTVLGRIDLDPASCLPGQEVVGAARWYGPKSPWCEDGLAEQWSGRVFLNPPGGADPREPIRSSIARWWVKLATSWDDADVDAAVFLGFSLEVLRLAQRRGVPSPLSFPLCVPARRIAFETYRLRGDGSQERRPSRQPVRANVIVLLPPDDEQEAVIGRFIEQLSPLGEVRV